MSADALWVATGDTITGLRLRGPSLRASIWRTEGDTSSMIQPDFDSYLKSLFETPLSEHTEHTGRTALENLLKSVAADQAHGNIMVQQEPKRVAEKGAPDFKVSRQGMIVGYVETKAVGKNLDHVLKSDQLKRYRSLSDNILLTDYLHFIWINKDGVQRESLCHATDLESRRFSVREDRAAAVAGLLQGFFSSAPEGIGRSQKLALALAARSRLLRDYLGEELLRQDKEDRKGRLYGLYQIFRDQVFHELTLKEFADAFAQMLAYGLLLAKINSDTETVTLQNAREFVPGSFRLIRELVDFLAELDEDEYQNVHWVVEEVLSIVNGLDMASILEDLSFRGRKATSRKVRATDEEEHRLFERDPFIYFYEDYLKAYDKATRKARGVYYTPPPVVNFIVRAIDDILKDSFSIKDGLADHRRVTVLDFACGTGTFLLEVFERIFEQIGGADSGRADLIVREHLLMNIFGFEYLIAPYTIAHLKLSQYLKDKGHPLEDDDRLKIFLTNTLEPIEPQPNLLLPAVSGEVEAAQRIKEQPILVITGNPPYSGHSKNKGTWSREAINGYKYTLEEDESGALVRKSLGERNPKWLNDDYVKFIRFAQLKMDEIEEGVVGVITNHSWLDNPTFRGMRQSLMRSFHQIFIIDLHGNAKKKERAPDGSKDENVFDIEQGVAITFFVKRPGLERGVWRSDIWGQRLVSRFRSSHDFRLLFSGFDCSEAEPLDGGEDVIGGFGPFEGFGVLVCRVDVVEDGALQLLGGAMDAAPDLFVGQQPEPALDLVEPGGAGGCEMGLPARPFGEPVADRLGLVGPVVVHDDVDVEISRDVRLDEVEEFAELSGPMARETFADDLSRGDVEGREERGRAVALVVVAAPLRLPGAHRQEGLGTVQGLDLALFVDTENQGTIRRRQIQTDDVADLLHEEGIARQLEGLRAMRLQAEGPPDAMNGRGRVAARPRHRAKAPMGRVRRRLFQRQPDRFRDGVIADLTRRAGAGFVVQTVEALRRIAATPLAHGVRARLETNGDLLVLQPFRRRQDDPSPPRKPLRRLATTRQRLQFGALVIAQRDRHRHSRHQSRLLKTNRDIIISIY